MSPKVTLVIDVLAVVIAQRTAGESLVGTTWFARTTTGVAVVAVIAAASALGSRVAMFGVRPGSELTHDFGSIPQHEAGSLLHVFVVKNTTATPFRIVSSSSSCGCTTSVTGSGAVNANEEVQIPVRVNWSNRAGPQLSSITVRTDSPRMQTISLIVQGDITVPLALRPTSINFGNVAKGSEIVREFAVVPGSDCSFRVLSIESSSSSVVVDLGQTTLPYHVTNREVSLRLRCTGNGSGTDEKMQLRQTLARTV